mgnify:CR=1 FL=1
MERYKSYKDSGIEWIGKIPSHWKIYRFKDFLTLQNVVSSNENKIGLENIEGGTGRFIETNTDFDGNGIEFDVGDIVYGKLRPYLQKVWVATFNGNAVGDFFVFRTKPICDRRYVFYVMLSEGFTAICNGATFGTKMPRVSSDFIRCLHFYLPPFVEQQAIAAYLDKRCSEIDKAIATQQKRIALLQELKQSIITHAVTRGIHPDVPLKESGVEWIGQVPSHWIHFRIKFCLSRSVAGIWGDDEKGNKDDIVCFRVADFDYSKGCLTFDKLTIRNVSAAQLQNRLLHDGDLLIEKSGGGDTTPVGRVVRFTYNDKAICSNFIHSISVKEGYCSNYLYYYFYGMYADKVNLLYFNQTTGIQNLKVGEYLSQKIYLPTLVEQQAIAVYLDGRCSEIDKAIATQQKRISLLQELKQSIITEAITGKIKVC